MVKGKERKVQPGSPKGESPKFGQFQVSSRLNLKVTEFSSEEDGEIDDSKNVTSNSNSDDDKKLTHNKKSKKSKKEKKDKKAEKKEKKRKKKEKKAKKKEKLMKLAEEIKEKEKERKNKFTAAHITPVNSRNLLQLKPEPVLVKKMARQVSNEPRSQTPPSDERRVVAAGTPPPKSRSRHGSGNEIDKTEPRIPTEIY